MKLCIRSLALASGILWGGMFLVVGLMNQLGGDYGAHLMSRPLYTRVMGVRRGSDRCLWLPCTDLSMGPSAAPYLPGSTIDFRKTRRR